MLLDQMFRSIYFELSSSIIDLDKIFYLHSIFGIQMGGVCLSVQLFTFELLIDFEMKTAIATACVIDDVLALL